MTQLQTSSTIECEPPQAAVPNFVIGGAPKSGTTAMAAYLRDHPAVWFSDPKEPFYWADDLAQLREREKVTTSEQYASLFRNASPAHAALGEGSTLYLYSQTAIPNILAEHPDMKFVFMLRRPDEIAHAYHMQMRFHFFEDVEDFEEAWRLQNERASGLRIPKACIEPALLQYRALASIGTQLQRAADLIPTSQRLVLLFDDFWSSPKREYQKLLAFLGLEDDHRTDFPKLNTAMQPRAAWLTKLLRTGPAKTTTRLLKQTLSGPARAAADRSKKWLMQRKSARPSLNDGFREEFISEFSNEVLLVERLLDRDLSTWK